MLRQVGLAAWSKYLLSYLGVAGLTLGHGNCESHRENMRPCKIVKAGSWVMTNCESHQELCMIDGTKVASSQDEKAFQ